MRKSEKARIKALTVTLAVVLAIGCAIGGSIAWLMDTTQPVTNTFSPSDISIELKESDNLELKMIPGWTITKDPYVQVLEGSEACYLFVKIEKSSNFDDFMTFAIADGWSKLDLDGADGNNDDGDNNALTDVYYRTVNATTGSASAKFSVIKNDTVTVKTAVTKENMNALTADTYPKLIFTAYATQLYTDRNTKMGVATAWDNVKDNPADSNNTP